jgi:small subunit ribosomal protein S1
VDRQTLAATRSIEVSDDQKGPDKGGSGPKKPRATFGDVMLGIPAGRGGEPQENPRGERRRDEPASAAPGTEPAAEPPRREPKKPERRKPRGPLVVVRRASGAIETRGPETPKSEEPAVAAVEGSTPPGAEPTAPATPPPARSALYEEVPEDQSFAEMFEAHAKQEGGTHRRLPRVGER